MQEGNGFNDPSGEEREDLGPHLSRFEEMMRNNGNYFFDVDVFEALIDHYLEKNDIKSALKGISIGISQHPDAVPILLRKAEIHASSGKLNKSLEILNRIEHLDPYNEDSFILKAGIYSQLRNHEEAIRCLKQAIRLAEGENDDLYVDLAFEYENLKKWDKAIECLKSALKSNPENEAAIFELAYCFEISGQGENSIQFFNDFIDNHPYSFSAWYNLGNSYIRKGLFEKAIEAFDFCITINENFSSAYFNKANAYVQLEMYHEAINCYAETFLYEEPQAITYCYIGECFEKLEMPEEAFENFLKATEIDEDLADGWLGMGIALSMMEKHKEAIPYLEKAKALEDKSSDTWYILGEVLDKANDISGSQQSFLKALELDGDNPELIMDYTDFLKRRFSLQEALEEMDKHILRFPQQAELLYRQSVYLLESGKKAQAMEMLAEALSLNFEEHEELFDYLPELKNNNDIVELIEHYRNS
ncbi:MAG: tetratricopeptide repeat protein [Flavobacteriales bacterium]|nr:tetratricopeptide repeat protein [Flavobacteriales bacterium]